MADMKQLRSGLLVPQQKPTRRYGAHEIRDEDRREQATQAMLDLWDAMDLSSNGGILDDGSYDLHYRLYRFIGETLLGKEGCPEKEILC